MSYHNLPQDATSLNRWMVTKVGSKKPYDPETMTQGDWKDPCNWGSFTSAWMAVFSGRAEHLGFVNVQAETGLMILDLDNKPDNPANEKQLQYRDHILEMTEGTYCEYSASTTETHAGYHIIVKCGTPLANSNREHIEFRADGFTVLTGWTMTGEQMPVLNGIDNNLLEIHRFLNGDPAKQIAVSEPETRSDDEIWNILENSANNEKLFRLKQGKDSETDYDICCWLAKLTRNEDQIVRLFMRTIYATGKKSDGSGVLESRVLHTARKALIETEVPQIDISKLMKPQQQLPVPVVMKSDNPLQITAMPEGWCKEFAKFTLANSMAPLEEAAVFASFLPVAGIGGRVFSVSGTGLNQQFTLLALTGTGKDEAVNAVQRVFTRVAIQEPGVVIQAFLADDFASAEGILRSLKDQPVMLGYVKESGMWMERMAKPNPDDHMLRINAIMLDIYNLHGAFLKGRKYAKKANDLDTVLSPALSTMSISTPRQFYDYLSIKMLENGLAGRELIMECADTDAKSRSYNYVRPDPPYYLTDGVIRLAKMARVDLYDSTSGSKPILATVEAQSALEYWREEYDRIKNSDKSPLPWAVWSRANLKMVKLAGTLAVAYAMMFDVNVGEMQQPIMLPEHVVYAAEVINYCSHQLLTKLSIRGVGNLYLQQEQVFDEAVDWYFSNEANLFTNVRNFQIREQMQDARSKGILFKSAIMTRCAGSAAFSGQGRSTAMELERTLKSKIASGLYAYVPTTYMLNEFKTRAEAFCRVDA